MDTKLEAVGRFLIASTYKVKRVDDALMITLENEVARARVYFRTKDDGDILSIELEPLEGDLHFDLSATHKHLNIVLFQMLRENYKNKFGSWEYNPDVGDLRFTVEIPLADTELSKKQFILIIKMLKRALNTQDELMFIAKNGRARINKYCDEFAEFMKQKYGK